MSMLLLITAGCSDAENAEFEKNETAIAAGNEVETSQESETAEAAANEDIGEAKAKSIALKKVPGAAETDIISFERDVEGGHIEYDGEIYYNGIEYEFEISAADGSVLSWEADRD